MCFWFSSPDNMVEGYVDLLGSKLLLSYFQLALIGSCSLHEDGMEGVEIGSRSSYCLCNLPIRLINKPLPSYND